MFRKNIRRRLIAAGHLLAHASEASVSNSRKSTYFRSAAILLATVIEALSYDLIKRNTVAPHVIDSQFKHKERHKISSKVFGTAGDLTICEKTKEDLTVDTEGVGFGKYIIFLKNKGIISSAEYGVLDWSRKERNKIHIQGLAGSDTGYTKKKINILAETITMLLQK